MYILLLSWHTQETWHTYYTPYRCSNLSILSKGKNKTTRASFFSYKNILWNKMAVRFLWLSVSFVPECQSASCIANNSSQLSDEAREIDDGSLSVTLSKTKKKKKNPTDIKRKKWKLKCQISSIVHHIDTNLSGWFSIWIFKCNNDTDRRTQWFLTCWTFCGVF
jgi:hypothetical protein